jgi:hypothetical protein
LQSIPLVSNALLLWQEYENCWLNMTGSDILSDISVHKLSQILLGEFRRLTKELQFTKRYHMCAYIKT